MALFDVPGWNMAADSNPVNIVNVSHKKRKRGKDGRSNPLHMSSKNTNIKGHTSSPMFEGDRHQIEKGRLQKKGLVLKERRKASDGVKTVKGAGLKDIAKREKRSLKLPKERSKRESIENNQSNLEIEDLPRLENSDNTETKLHSTKQSSSHASQNGMNLTSMQANMRSSLNGARFRY